MRPWRGIVGAACLTVVGTVIAVPSVSRGTEAPKACGSSAADKWRRSDPADAFPCDPTLAARKVARGECESIQWVFSAPSDNPLRIDEASWDRWSTPSGRRTDPAPELRWHKVDWVRLTQASNTEGSAGWWPDPLIPFADPDTGERRAALPLRVEAGERGMLWVDVCAPRALRPGRYRSTLRARTAAGTTLTLPIRIDVATTTLPPRPLHTLTIGLSGRSLEVGHTGTTGDRARRLSLVRQYARLALRYRVSLHTMSMLPPPARWDGTTPTIDFATWDDEIGSLLDGTEPGLDGARFGMVDVRWPRDVEPEALSRWMSAVWEHAMARGWRDRLFVFPMDEPDAARIPALTQLLDAMGQAPIPRLVTSPWVPELDGRVDLWTPNLRCLFHKTKTGEFCPGERPSEWYRQRPSTRLWWYQSCTSHGCASGPVGDARDALVAGWPRYVIDAPGGAARVMGWLAFLNGIDGELYFDAAQAFNRRLDGVDPWSGEALWAFGGNGDGTLVYPGTADRLGGRLDQAVASVRLSCIRDGLEDADLLRLLARRDPAEARRIGRMVAPSAFGFSLQGTAYDRGHDRLIDALERLGSAR